MNVENNVFGLEMLTFHHREDKEGMQTIVG